MDLIQWKQCGAQVGQYCGAYAIWVNTAVPMPYAMAKYIVMQCNFSDN